MLSPRTLTRLSSIAVFLNTAPGPRGGHEQPEQLTAGTQLASVVPALQEGEVRLRVAAAALSRAHELRAQLTEAWTLAATDEPAATEGINTLLASVGPLRLVTAEDAAGFAPAQTPSDAVERLTALAALALAEAAVDGELSRLRVCAGEDCENALVDASRNRSKRFCDEANCANRTHVRSYRARLAEAGDDVVGGEAVAAESDGEERTAPAEVKAKADVAEAGKATSAEPREEKDAKKAAKAKDAKPSKAEKKAKKQAKKDRKKSKKKAKGD